VVPVQASNEIAPSQAFIAMHWGEEYLSGLSASGTPLAGVNALTTSAYCPSSKQPELKHAAVKIIQAEMPWTLLAMAWIAPDKVLSVRQQLKPLMQAFAFTSSVPFSNNAPLDQPEQERSGLLFRAAAYEAPPDELISQIEAILGLDGSDCLHYADSKKGQRRSMRLQRVGEDAHLMGFVLAGDTSAQAWIKTLLQDQLPAQSYGRLLLQPGAKAPIAVQARGKLVCSCFNVSDTAIDACLQDLSQGMLSAGAGFIATDGQRLQALQDKLQCGTNCGSCVPELKRRIRSANALSKAG
jgi:assimilatory nitrate reductase catalytic subunit